MTGEWIDGELRTPDERDAALRPAGNRPDTRARPRIERQRPVLVAAASALEGSYDIVAFDARSHGLSDTAGAGAPSPGADLVTVVEALGLSPTLAAGTRWGRRR